MWAALNELQDSAKKLAAEQLSDFQSEYETAQATAAVDFDPAALFSPIAQIGSSVRRARRAAATSPGA